MDSYLDEEDEYRLSDDFAEVVRTTYLEGNEDELLGLLRSDYPISRDLRLFIADILEGNVKQKKGAKKKLNWYELGERHVEYLCLKYEIEHERDDKSKLHGERSVAQEALARLANKYNVSEGVVDKWVYKRKG